MMRSSQCRTVRVRSTSTSSSARARVGLPLANAASAAARTLSVAAIETTKSIAFRGKSRSPEISSLTSGAVSSKNEPARALISAAPRATAAGGSGSTNAVRSETLSPSTICWLRLKSENRSSSRTMHTPGAIAAQPRAWL
eukprot:Amastigsp_a677886_7.p3 type:complete len:140 gc:universal Amastigsp_a677886_7:1070-651(-)